MGIRGAIAIVGREKLSWCRSNQRWVDENMTWDEELCWMLILMEASPKRLFMVVWIGEFGSIFA